MKKIVLAVLAIALVACAEAQEAREIMARYGRTEGNTFISIDKKMFNMLKPAMGLDKETRQLFKILEVKTVDVLQMKCGADAEKARAELDSLGVCGSYKSAPDCLFKVEGSRVTAFIIYSRSPKDSSLVAMHIECDSESAKLEEFISQQNKETDNQ